MLAVASRDTERSIRILGARESRLADKQARHTAAQSRARNAAKAKARRKSNKRAAKARKKNRR